MSPARAALMSLVLPCLGEFYLGHPILGLLELAGYALLWLVIGLMLNDGEYESLPGVLIFLLITHVIDAVLTLHVAQKGIKLQSQVWKSH